MHSDGKSRDRRASLPWCPPAPRTEGNKPPARRRLPTRHPSEILSGSHSECESWRLRSLQGSLNRGANSLVGAAAANTAAHQFINVLIARPGFALQQRNGLHDLSCLAVTALRNVVFHPGALDRMQTVQTD